MEPLKKRWHSLPTSIRKPLVLTVGLLVVVASPFTGILPGPGGIPVFLIGIAILSTEFEWARRIREPIVRWAKQAGEWWQQHKIIGTLLIVAIASVFGGLSYLLYSKF